MTTDFTPDHLNAAQIALKSGMTLGQFLRTIADKVDREELQKYSAAYVALRNA